VRARGVTKPVPQAAGTDQVWTAAGLDDEPRPTAPELTELFRQHHAALVRLAALLVHDLPTAEDVTQDVFAALQSRPGGLRLEPGGELSYLRVCVINGCRSVHRRRAIWRRISGRSGYSGLDTAQPSAEYEVIKAEERQQVLSALADLPARRREVLVLRYYLGMSEAQIASTLGISAGTVKSTAARAVATLARKLGETS
jgi:RNA polymerase sigma-70 factor (sigma-E family)